MTFASLSVKVDFHCRVDFTQITQEHLTGYTFVNKIQEILWTACVQRKSWTALNFYVERKLSIQFLVFYLRT